MIIDMKKIGPSAAETHLPPLLVQFCFKIHPLPMVRTEHSQDTKGLQSRFQCLYPCPVLMNNSQ